MSTQESLAVSQTPHQEGHIKAINYKWMEIEMVQCPCYRGHIIGTAKQRWLNSDKWIWLPFHCRRKFSSPCSMPKKKLGFLLAPEVDILGSLVPQKLCSNNAPAVPGAPFRTGLWRCLTCQLQLGQNTQKIPHHTTPHDLGRIKHLTLGISFWNWIERFGKNFMSLSLVLRRKFMAGSWDWVSIWATLQSPQVWAS